MKTYRLPKYLIQRLKGIADNSYTETAYPKATQILLDMGLIERWEASGGEVLGSAVRSHGLRPTDLGRATLQAVAATLTASTEGSDSSEGGR